MLSIHTYFSIMKPLYLYSYSKFEVLIILIMLNVFDFDSP